MNFALAELEGGFGCKNEEKRIRCFSVLVRLCENRKRCSDICCVILKSSTVRTLNSFKYEVDSVGQMKGSEKVFSNFRPLLGKNRKRCWGQCRYT